MVDTTEQELRGLVVRINQIRTSQSSNFVHLLKLSGLPNDYFRGRVMKGYDLRGCDLSSLNLEGTKFVDCLLDSDERNQTPDYEYSDQIRNKHEGFKKSETIRKDDFESFRIAIQGNDIEALNALIDAGADVNVINLDYVDNPDNNKGAFPLLLAAKQGCHECVDRLIEAEADISLSTKDGQTALMAACRYGQEAVALRLVEKNVGLDTVNKDGETALMLACQHDQEAVALKLVEKAVNLDTANLAGMTALMFACRFDQEAIALRLIEKVANLDAENEDGWTALMFACCYFQEDVALKLVEEGVGISHKDNVDQTILMFAVNSGQKGVVKALLEREVNTDDIWDADGPKFTALGLARRQGHYEIIEMLEAADALELPPYNPS